MNRSNPRLTLVIIAVLLTPLSAITSVPLAQWITSNSVATSIARSDFAIEEILRTETLVVKDISRMIIAEEMSYQPRFEQLAALNCACGQDTDSGWRAWVYQKMPALRAIRRSSTLGSHFLPFHMNLPK